jgi:anhydro-N-acetylmuramic acid kinase
MSGTSLDGADGALVDFSEEAPRTVAFGTRPYPNELRGKLLRLSEPGDDGIDLMGGVSIALAEVYASVVESVLAAGNARPEDVIAIGCHGQTVRHRPEHGFTVQLNDPARLAERTGIDVVADFRRRDMAAGGQGAPLTPAFHEAVFRHAGRSRAVVNIGGISNITWMPPGRPTLGFDCGPGNVMLDGWTQRHRGENFDEHGAWAETGHTDAALLARFLKEPFLSAAPPKSTGRELFRMQWLDERLDGERAPADVQSTLTDFTARAIVEALARFCPVTEEIYLAGGGARNRSLVRRIKALTSGTPVETTDFLGVPTGHVESLAFAWLAMKFMRREPVDLTAVTGARHACILGALYPA